MVLPLAGTQQRYGACCVGVGADDIRVLMYNDGGHRECFPSALSMDRYRSGSAEAGPGSQSLPDKTVMSHNAAPLDMLLPSHPGGLGGVDHILQLDNSQVS